MDPEDRRAGKLSRSERITRMLGELQHDVEFAGSPEVKRQRRAILRGMRLACWLLVDAKPPVAELAREFRTEVFGWAPDALPSLDRAQRPVRSGVPDNEL